MEIGIVSHKLPKFFLNFFSKFFEGRGITRSEAGGRIFAVPLWYCVAAGRERQMNSSMKWLGVTVLCLGLTVAQTINPAADSKKTFVGLPQYGVTLTGDPGKPTIVNTSGKVILAWVLWQQDATGFGPSGITIETQNLRNGITRTGPTAVAPTGGVLRPDGTLQGAFVKATLQAVVFGDGEYVGEDSLNSFQIVSAGIAAERTFAQLVLSKKISWAEIEALAEDRSPTKTARGPAEAAGLRARANLAGDLVHARQQAGDEIALGAAEWSSKLPVIWRAQK